jgi:hypothetical protein
VEAWDIEKRRPSDVVESTINSVSPKSPFDGLVEHKGRFKMTIEKSSHYHSSNRRRGSRFTVGSSTETICSEVMDNFDGLVNGNARTLF